MKIQVELTHDELSALMTALNAGVQSLGARIVVPLAPVLTKLDQAAQAAETQENNDG